MTWGEREEMRKLRPISERLNISVLKGKTLANIRGAVKDSDDIWFHCSDGSIYKMYHDQDCCESVFVEDICGEISDLLDSPILMAEEVESYRENPPGVKPPYQDNSYTWTFYKLATIKGYVTIRWYGESNGYYSESANFEQI